MEATAIKSWNMEHGTWNTFLLSIYHEIVPSCYMLCVACYVMF